MNVFFRHTDGRRRAKPVALAALAALCLLSAGYSQTPSYDVPLHDPVYGYLSLLPFPGRAGDVDLSTRPFSEAQVCTLLVYAEKNGLCSDTSIHHLYLRRFSVAPDGCAGGVRPPAVGFDGCRTFAYPYLVTSFNAQDSNFSIAGFNAAGADGLSDAQEFCNATKIGGRLYATLWRALLQFDGMIATEYSTQREWVKMNDPRTGVRLTTIMAEKNKPGHFIGYDDFTASLHLPLPWLDLKIGNDRVSWGYADSSGLMFSGAGSPFMQVKMDKAFGDLNYSFLAGRLLGDTYQERRVMYAKHITYTPRRWISLGFSDAVITVNRDFEPVYCMPFVPFYFTEHYLGDQDNRIMSFDGRAIFRNRVSVYGELVMDDISNLAGFFTNESWGDKWGGLFGMKVFNPLPFFPASAATAEVVQVEPWVYTTSARPEQAGNNYPVNFGRPLGNQMGPHSRCVKLDLSARISRLLGASLTIQQLQKGTGYGSSVFDTNSYIIETIDGRIVGHHEHESKEYRFSDFARDRVVVSGRVCAYAKEWLQLDLDAALALEQEPEELNLYQVGMKLMVNY